MLPLDHGQQPTLLDNVQVFLGKRRDCCWRTHLRASIFWEHQAAMLNHDFSSASSESLSEGDGQGSPQQSSVTVRIETKMDLRLGTC